MMGNSVLFLWLPLVPSRLFACLLVSEIINFTCLHPEQLHDHGHLSRTSM